MARAKPHPPHERDLRRTSIVQPIQTTFTPRSVRENAGPYISPSLTPSTAADPPLPISMDEETAKALRAAGYKGGAQESTPTSASYTICSCSKTVSEDYELDLEKFIRCGNRDCSKTWFHLTCVNLPDHPPMRLAWMCPGCIKSHRVAESLRGLWDLKGGMEFAKEWLREEELLKVKKENERRRRAFWRSLQESSDEDGDA